MIKIKFSLFFILFSIGLQAQDFEVINKTGQENYRVTDRKGALYDFRIRVYFDKAQASVEWINDNAAYINKIELPKRINEISQWVPISTILPRTRYVAVYITATEKLAGQPATPIFAGAAEVDLGKEEKIRQVVVNFMGIDFSGPLVTLNVNGKTFNAIPHKSSLISVSIEPPALDLSPLEPITRPEAKKVEIQLFKPIILKSLPRSDIARFGSNGDIAWLHIDNKVVAFDSSTARPLREIGQGGEIRWFEISSNGQQILTKDSNNKCQMWNANTGHQLFEFQLLERPKVIGGAFLRKTPVNIRFFPDNSKILVVSNERVTIWSGVDGTLLETIRPTADVYQCSISRDGKEIACNLGTEVQVFDIDPNTGKRIATIVIPANIKDKGFTLFNHDGKQLIAVGTRVTVWDIESGKQLFLLEEEGKPYWHRLPSSHEKNENIDSVSLNQDGDSLLTVSSGMAKIWKMQTGQLTRMVKTNEIVDHAAFIPKTNWVLRTIEKQEGFSIVGVISEIIDPSGKSIMRLGDEVFNQFRVFGFTGGTNPFQISSDGTKVLIHYFDSTEQWIIPSQELLSPPWQKQSLRFLAYISALKSYIKASEDAEKEPNYSDFIEYYGERTNPEIADQLENTIFNSLTPESKIYINKLIPGRPSDV